MATLIYGAIGDVPKMLERTHDARYLIGPPAGGGGQGHYICQQRAVNGGDSIYRWMEDQALPAGTASPTDYREG